MTTAFTLRVLAGLTLLTIASPLAAFADDDPSLGQVRDIRLFTNLDYGL